MADEVDLDAVVPVVRAIRADSPLGAQLVNPESDDVTQHLHSWFSMPGTCLAVAEYDDQIVGVAMGQMIDVNVFTDVAYLQMEALFVDPTSRRRGAGRALMSQMALQAAQGGAEHVVTMPIAGMRSEQRFLSGLGFGVVGARRIITTVALLRRLEAPPKGRERRHRGLDELIAKRRRSRGLPPTPPAGIALSDVADWVKEQPGGRWLRDRSSH